MVGSVDRRIAFWLLKQLNVYFMATKSIEQHFEYSKVPMDRVEALEYLPLTGIHTPSEPNVMNNDVIKYVIWKPNQLNMMNYALCLSCLPRHR